MITAHPFRLARATNSTASAFTAKTPTATKPSGAGVIDLFDSDLGLAINTYLPKYVQLLPLGTDANDETFDLRLWGWSKTVGLDDEIWVPQMLVDLTVTLGNIAATAIGADHYLADTLVVNEGSAELTFADPITTADDTPASILVHLRGCELIEFDFDLVLAAAANCLWRVMDEN